MILPVALFLGLAFMMISYSIGQGGPIAAMVLLAFITGGAVLRYAQPLLEKLKP